MYVEIFLRLEDVKLLCRGNKYAIDDLLEDIWETTFCFVGIPKLGPENELLWRIVKIK